MILKLKKTLRTRNTTTFPVVHIRCCQKSKQTYPQKQSTQFENRLRCHFLITVQSVGRRMRCHRALPRRKWGSCLRAPSVGFRCTPETTMSPPGERKILYTQTDPVYQVRACACSKYEIGFFLQVKKTMKYGPRQISA